MAPSDRAASTAARLGVAALDLRVTEVSEVAPWLRELRVEGDLAGFEPLPGQDVMVLVPPGAPDARWRRYTVRRVDPDDGWLELWVTTECDGPGAAWAAEASPGDPVEGVGPRGKIGLDPQATTHLFVVDAAGLAAMCAMAEALDAPATVASVCALPPVADADQSRATLPVCAEDVVTRHHVTAPDDPAWLSQVVRVSARSLDPAESAAYVFGELTVVRDVAAQLVELGLDPARVASKAYWRADRSNAEHGEPERDGA